MHYIYFLCIIYIYILYILLSLYIDSYSLQSRNNTQRLCNFPRPDIYNFLWPLFVDGVQLLQGYAEPLQRDSLLLTRNSWYSLH